MNKLRILRAYCCFQVGTDLVAGEALEDAMLMFSKAIQLNPRKSEYFKATAMLAIEISHFEEALLLINKYKRFRSSHKSLVYLLKGDAYYGLGQYKRAHRCYSRISSPYSHLSEVRVRKARCFMAKNKYCQAMRELDRPLVEVENFEFNFYKGVCCFFKSEYRRAIQHFNQAAFDQRFRENVDLLYLKASSHYNIGEYERAIISYE